MREIRPSGSEGGEPQINAASLPLSKSRAYGVNPAVRNPGSMPAMMERKHFSLPPSARITFRLSANRADLFPSE